MMVPSGHDSTKGHFIANVEGLSDNFRDILAGGYGLAVIGHELRGDLEIARHQLAAVDVEFTLANPGIPAENVLSRLGNYVPRNETQEGLLGLAHRITAFHGMSRLAGVIACGQAGLGKTHIAVGVAKQTMLSGSRAAYVDGSSQRGVSTSKIERIADEADIIIIDDLNTRHGHGGDFFRQLIPIMHNRGNGKLLVTTNIPSPDEFIEELIGVSAMISAPESVRLKDRVAGALLGCVVEGESYRRVAQEDQAPWWDDHTSVDSAE